jgi:NitT/TauT family transport system substrate-binding protein
VAAAAEYDAAFQKLDAQGKRVFGPGSDELMAIITKYTKTPPEVIKASLPYIDPQGRLLVRDLYDQVRWYQGQKMVDAGVDPKSIVDLSFVKGHLDVPK